MTTVTIDDETHEKLKKLKEKEGSKSFNQLLNDIAEKELEIPDSEDMFGSMNLKDSEEVRSHKDRAERYD